MKRANAERASNGQQAQDSSGNQCQTSGKGLETKASGTTPPIDDTSNSLASSDNNVQHTSVNTGNPDFDTQRERYIFLVGSSGSLQFRQFSSSKQCTQTFAADLRANYRKLRGFWRYWFSIYIFWHCDFFEFEKFCLFGISDIKPGLPREEYPYTEEYYYKPRPARSKTPISPKEFEHIYYHYRKTSAAKIDTWYQPFTIDGNLPTDTVPKIPQRLTHFDELSNNRETFWGLHAREQVSAMMVLIYALVAFTPSLAFCFVYWFGLGDKQPDMQNATTPLTISLTTFGLFVAYLVKH
ncbi:hypothetical protein CCHR01_06634 [Colletotrichum chrysophilum]|uniref:Uncharacterized protein n=1 Tax=Colletotrichum chrysophilum TaxID=1836956 RepID=A0AAD9ALN7_9PEZI|nr:hypothetical protein CCHR01_06634 [Colletotrichum chrysophilum]